METYNNKIQTHEVSTMNANTDNPVKHSNSIENNVEKNGSMEQQAVPTITFQSKTNAKVKVTLEFGDEITGANSKKELEEILKHLFIEKNVKKTFLFEAPALQSNSIKSD